jgi:hypothetical protein
VIPTSIGTIKTELMLKSVIQPTVQQAIEEGFNLLEDLINKQNDQIISFGKNNIVFSHVCCSLCWRLTRRFVEYPHK